MNSKKKMVFLSVGIILAGLLIAGGTYAYLTIAANVKNGNYVGNTTCFSINYDITNADGTLPITGTLLPSANPSGGLVGNLSIGVKSGCSVSGLGNLHLVVSSGGNVLFQKVATHCENAKTLKTLTQYTTSSACTAVTGNVWVTNGSALKYAIYDNNNPTSSQPLSVGYIDRIADINIYNQFSISSTAKTYYIYIWLDGNFADETYLSQPFSGYIYADATQVE